MGYQALLFCPDDKLARVVTQVLSDLDFSVETATEPFAAVKKLMAQHFDAVVVDCDNEQNATLLFKSARNSSSNQSSLAVAVVEGQAGVAKAFRIGANLVLTKPINVEQAKGTLRVARGLLRKGGDAKAAPPKAASTAPTQPVRPPAQVAKKPVTPVYEPKVTPTAPVARASATPLEVEHDPTPNLDAADLAMLESLRDPVAPSATESKPSKDFAWQAAKGNAGPMASALQRAAEAAGKTVEPAPAKPHLVVEAQKSASSSRGSAAAAPAMAREFSESSVETAATEHVSATPAHAEAHSYSEPARETSAPSFSAYGLDDEAEESSKSKKPYFIVAAIVVAGGMAFYGWTMKHSSSSPTPATVAPAATTPTETVPAQTTPSPAPPAQNSQSSTPETSSTDRDQTPTSHSAKPSAAKTPLVAEDTVTKVAPLVVRNDSGAHSASAASEPAPQAPGALSIASGSSNDSALSSLVASTPVNVPKHTPQTLRISQGVSQGLILKRVQPAYPAQAMQMRIQGAVQLLATISKEGQISNLSVLNGDSILARAATDAVRQWKYKPYYLNGEPVEIQTQITVNFKLPN
jgi:TonB family C-terminal domain